MTRIMGHDGVRMPTTTTTSRSRRRRRAVSRRRPCQRHRRRDRIHRRRGRGRGNRRPASPAGPALQDSGSRQGPADHAGPGRQGGTRQQGCGADHLSVACGPLLRADAEHGAGRRDFPQDHQCGGPQEAEGNRGRAGGAGRCGPDRPHRGGQADQARDQARLRIPDAAVGADPRTDAEVDRSGQDLRGRRPDQTVDPRSLQPRDRRGAGRRRGRLSHRQGLHADDHAEPRQAGGALQDQTPLFAKYQVEGYLRACSTRWCS
jgi:hypothetical protein